MGLSSGLRDLRPTTIRLRHGTASLMEDRSSEVWTVRTVCCGKLKRRADEAIKPRYFKGENTVKSIQSGLTGEDILSLVTPTYSIS